MKIKSYRIIRYIVIAVFIVVTCTSCSSDIISTTSSKGYHKAGKVTIRFLSNLPERESGQGKLEQLLIDKYMSENSNVNIEVEAYQDEPYKQRFKAYAISDNLPDIFFVWGQPSFFNPVMKGGYVCELDSNKFKKDEFKDGALEGFSLDGRLYGVPKSMDYMALYYNKDLFNKNGIELPNNFKELIEVCKSFRDKGIIPITINIKDKWPLALLYQELVLMEGQDQSFIYDAIHGKESFIDNPVFKKAAEDLKLLIDACGIADTMTQLDYNTSMNLFTKKESAMIYTGSWEIGMVNNTELPEEFRNQMEVSKMPLVLESNSNDDALVAWNGGGYAISSKSQVKDEAIKFLEYLMKPENWAKKGFEKGLIVPAQKYENYSNKKETKIQKELVGILNNSKSLSGTSWHDSLTPNFKLNIEELCYQLAAGRISPDYFLKEIDKEVKSENISSVK
ncbi:ABC transporter substrate-binding protein [Clostridium folliculivorans]|uniref:ABC transporter extracellular-binding protein YurO n=1 Tax=Clostridium folliculivorans TaxID=2886038 RepID=A0A9W5Y4B6_9CLOT|nr:extracellular solute-binding protein [Clostridium folliculivorans]GKU26285.1 putative ABC transporter extracellular-binding protein YurO [Clostridium folliculivorans]GKU31957.1 putative ABC transporter extracellular-binding protein YurO [Clostridium folliculivorans]